MLKKFFILWPISLLSQDQIEVAKLYNSCIKCHGERGEGSAEKRVPRIGRQYDWYLVDALTDFNNGERMDPGNIHQNIRKEDVIPLADHISSFVVEIKDKNKEEEENRGE